MFIRCTRTRSRSSGEPYLTYRLVQTAREGGAVKQTTLLNLGSHLQRLGRAKQRCARAAQHYLVEVAKDATGTQVSAILG